MSTSIYIYIVFNEDAARDGEAEAQDSQDEAQDGTGYVDIEMD